MIFTMKPPTATIMLLFMSTFACGAGSSESLSKYLTDAWSPLEIILDGDIISRPAEITLSNKDSNYCMISGILKPTIPFPDLQTDIAHLPESCRPSGALVFVQLGEFGPLRVDLFPNGTLQIAEGPNLFYVQTIGFGTWLSLDGMAILIPSQDTRTEDMSSYLHDPWTGGYLNFAGPTITNVPGQCVLSGSVQTTEALNDSLVAILPEKCRPSGSSGEQESNSHIFIQQAETRAVRVEVSSDGSVRAVASPRNWIIGTSDLSYGNMLSFQNMKFHTSFIHDDQDQGKTVVERKHFDISPYLNAPWVVTPDFKRPVFLSTPSGRCDLHGVVATSTPQDVGSIVATLPKMCSPANPHIFAAQAELGFVRLDISPNGEIAVSANYPNAFYHFREATYGTWVSLDGISFMKDPGEEPGFPKYGYALIVVGVVFILFIALWFLVRWWRSTYKIHRIDQVSLILSQVDDVEAPEDSTIKQVELE